MTISHAMDYSSPSPQFQPNVSQSKDWTVFDLILPPQAFPLLALLFVILPMILLTGESLFIPLIEWLKGRMMLGNESSFDMLPLHFYLKLGAFLLLSFLGAFQLLLRINAIYYSVWSKQFECPHPLHTEYQPSRHTSINTLMIWKLYRVAMIILPPLGMIVLSAIVGAVELYLFNILGELPFLSISIQVTISIFIMLMLGMLCLFTVLSSLWHILTTLFGDVIAVTEPKLTPKKIFDRSNRIAYSSPQVYAFYATYCVFILIALGLFGALIYFVDIYDFLRLKTNLPLILSCEFGLFVGYILLNYYRFHTYHHALGAYYQKLPKQMKEFFHASASQRSQS
ncbi:MAG: hypothetical protein VKJ04_02650 [Vampirovibrionales bacterium]|nr:hypothetical protein [Vampirovibrionales bacterium]